MARDVTYVRGDELERLFDKPQGDYIVHFGDAWYSVQAYRFGPSTLTPVRVVEVAPLAALATTNPEEAVFAVWQCDKVDRKGQRCSFQTQPGKDPDKGRGGHLGWHSKHPGKVKV